MSKIFIELRLRVCTNKIKGYGLTKKFAVLSVTYSVLSSL